MSAPSKTYVYIFWVTISVEFPNARNTHSLPRSVVERGVEEVGRTLVGILYPIEFPIALDRKII